MRKKGVLREARILTALNATAAPDTGNAEILALFGTEAQKAQHLGPQLGGRDRVVFFDDRAAGRCRPRRIHLLGPA